MAQYLDFIRIGKTPAVIGAVYDDGTCQVVYNSGVHIVYEDATQDENGVWKFVDDHVSAAYAKGEPHLQDAIDKLTSLT